MILDVVRTGWMNLRRDRAAMILSFIVPIVFFSIFASIFGSRRSGTPKVTMAVVDEDRSDRSRRLIEGLRHETALTLQEKAKNDAGVFDAPRAEAYVRAGNAPVALVIPKGFGTSRISFGQNTTGVPALRLLFDSSDQIAPEVVKGLLQKAIFTAVPDMMMTGGVDAMDRWGGGVTPQQRATLEENIRVFQSRPKTNKAAGGADGMPVNIQSTDVVAGKSNNPIIAFYAAGIGVMFLLFTATNAGGALLEENESGTLDRILTTRLSLTKLLLGKFVYLCTLNITQLVVMFVWGALVFGLPLRTHLTGFAIMAVVTAAACSAFGLLLASIARTRAQLSAMSTLAVLSISAIGGSMFPRLLMPPSFQKAGLVLFNAWAIEGFTKVFWRNEPLTELLWPVVVLIAFATAFFLIARQLTRRWDVG